MGVPQLMETTIFFLLTTKYNAPETPIGFSEQDAEVSGSRVL